MNRDDRQRPFWEESVVTLPSGERVTRVKRRLWLPEICHRCNGGILRGEIALHCPEKKAYIHTYCERVPEKPLPMKPVDRDQVFGMPLAKEE